MKKLLILIGLFITCLTFGQTDSLNIAGITELNQLPTDAYMWFWYIDGSDTIDRNVRGQYIQPFYRSGYNLYPRSTSHRLLLGTTTYPDAENYMLHVAGSGRFTNHAYIGGNLKFPQGYITTTGGQMYFYDNTVGLLSLNELLSTQTSSGRNGITFSSGYYELGGTLTKLTQISTNGYIFNVGETNANFIVNPGTGTVEFDAQNIFHIDCEDHIEIDADDLDINAQYAFRLMAQGSSYPNKWYDFTTTPYGLTMPDWDTYFLNIKNDIEDGALVTYGMLREHTTDSAGTGTGVGNYIENSKTGKDTLWIPAIVEENPSYDGSDTIDFIPFIIDTLSANSYCSTVTLPSDSILNGTDMTCIPTPGSGYSIDIWRVKFYLGSGTAYVGSGSSTLEVGSNVIATFSAADIGVDETTVSNITHSVTYDINATLSNLPVTFDIYNTFTAGNRAGWMKIYYYINED